MPLPSSPVQSHNGIQAQLSFPAMTAQGVRIADEVVIIGSPGGDRGDNTLGWFYEERPANQHDWTPDHMRTLQRDREHAQAMRDLYIVSNPDEFPNLFADPNETPDERITPANLLDNMAESDAAVFGEPYVDAEYTNATIPEDGSQDDDMSAFLDEELAPVRPAQPDDDGDEERAIAEGYGLYGTSPAQIIANVRSICSGMTEFEGQQLQRRFEDLVIYHRSNVNLPRWQRNLVLGITIQINAERAERERERRSHEAWVEVQRLEELLESGLLRRTNLRVRYIETQERFANEDSETSEKFVNFQMAVRRVAYSASRRYDMYTWFPKLPQYARDLLDDMAGFHRYIRGIRLLIQRERCEAFGEELTPGDPSDEDYWAASAQLAGQAFGYEQIENPNGFSDFVLPDPDASIDEQLSWISDSALVRGYRVELAAARIGENQDRQDYADSLVPGQFLSWLTKASEHLTQLHDIGVEGAELTEAQKSTCQRFHHAFADQMQYVRQCFQFAQA